MNRWWLRNFARLASEKLAVETLATDSDWFDLTRWSINQGRFCAEGVISAHGATYPIFLVYPDPFPSVPAWVEPQDSSVRWSNHQYGNGGILCLELRPDNWTPLATGADVLQSAYNLLHMENPLGAGAQKRVRSGHNITDVQSYDWDLEPVLIGEGCLQRIIDGESCGVSAFRWQADDSVWPIMVFDAVDSARPQHPPSFDLGTFRLAVPVVLGRGDPESPTPPNRAALGAALSITFDPEVHGGAIVALAVSDDGVIPYHSLEVDKVFRRKLVVLPDDSGLRSGRAPSADNKTVAVIGIGSVGSKLAETLLRSGIHRLVLVDGDVFLPGNIERHALDWRDVGFRKANAVCRRLRHIVPGASVEALPVNLNWQRSAKSHAVQFQTILAADLIVDATGDAPTSLMLGAIAADAGRPLVSVSVFEGGLGCLVARSFPTRDPSYGSGRAAFLAFCDEQDVVPPPSGRRTYEALNENGEPVVADDAAVTMAAAHAARVGLDILDDRINEDDRPWLLFGFKVGWLFKHHGHTISLNVGVPTQTVDEEPNEEAQIFAIELAEEAIRAAEATSRSSQGSS